MCLARAFWVECWWMIHFRSTVLPSCGSFVDVMWHVRISGRLMLRYLREEYRYSNKCIECRTTTKEGKQIIFPQTVMRSRTETSRES